MGQSIFTDFREFWGSFDRYRKKTRIFALGPISGRHMKMNIWNLKNILEQKKIFSIFSKYFFFWDEKIFDFLQFSRFKDTAHLVSNHPEMCISAPNFNENQEKIGWLI